MGRPEPLPDGYGRGTGRRWTDPLVYDIRGRALRVTTGTFMEPSDKRTWIGAVLMGGRKTGSFSRETITDLDTIYVSLFNPGGHPLDSHCRTSNGVLDD